MNFEQMYYYDDIFWCIFDLLTKFLYNRTGKT